MYKVITTILLFMYASTIVTAQHQKRRDSDRIMHKQHLHQYLVLEAFKILQAKAPREAAILENHIGDMNTGAQPWQARSISAGAFREDEEDIVYSYGGFSNVLDPDIDIYHGSCIGEVYYQFESELKSNADFRKGLVSATHFWDPDATDTWLTKSGINIDGTGLLDCLDTGNFWLTIKPEAHALTKAQTLFATGTPGAIRDWWWESGEVFSFQNGPDWTVPNTLVRGLDYLLIGYESLADVMNTGRVFLTLNGIVGQDGPPIAILTPAQRNKYVWEILGRICHLLTDMSVPAHTHNDIHSGNAYETHNMGLLGSITVSIQDADSYEQWIAHAGSGQGGDLSNIWWDAQRVIDWSQQHNVSAYLDPSNQNDPLTFLMTNMRNLTASFASDDFDGTGGRGLPELITDIPFRYEDRLNPPQSQVEVMQNIRDVTIPECIRSIAGLLYWFANQIDPPPIVFSVVNLGTNSWSTFLYRENIADAFITSYSFPKVFDTKVVGDYLSVRSHYDLYQANNSKFFSWQSLENDATAKHQNNFILKENQTDFEATFKESLTQQNSVPVLDFMLEYGLVPPSNAQFLFKNPWLVNPSPPHTNQYTLEQKDEFIGYNVPYQSLLSPTNNGGVFLNVPLPDLFKPPYYSIRASKVLDGQTMAHKSTNHVAGDWLFTGWSASQADLLTDPQDGSSAYPNPSQYDTKAVIFRDAASTVTANYKAHRLSRGITTPTSKNSQRKIAVGLDGVHHAVYESDGAIYYLKSTDRGAVWSPEQLISDRAVQSTRPSICESQGSVYIVYATQNQIIVRAYGGWLWQTVYTAPVQSPWKPNPVIAVTTLSSAISCTPNVVFIAWEDDAATKYVLKFAALNGTQVLIDNEVLNFGQTSGMIQYEPLFPTVSIIPDEQSFEAMFHCAWFEEGSIYYAPITFSCVSNQMTISGWTALIGLGGVEIVHDRNGGLGQLYPALAGPSLAISPAVGNGSLSTVVVAYDIAAHRYKNLPVKMFLVRERYENMLAPSWLTTGNVFVRRNDAPNFLTPSVATGGASIPPTNLKLPKSKYIRIVYNATQNSSNVARFVGTGIDIALLAEPGKDPNITAWSSEPINLLCAYSGTASYPFNYSVLSTRNNFFKSTTTGSYNQRELVCIVDTAVSALSVGSMKQLAQNNYEAQINWDSAEDSLLIGVNTTVDAKMRTESFAVQQSASFVFNRITSTINGLQFPAGASFLVRMHNATDSSVLLTEQIPFSALTEDGDTLQHVIDLSSLAGYSVFMTVGLSNNLPKTDVHVLDVHSTENPFPSRRLVDRNRAQLSSTIALAQNHPNPLTAGDPSTEIRYSIPESDHVSIVVTDMLGRTVATLIDGEKSAGLHTVRFDASILPSGVYYYRLIANGQTLTKKMTILK